MNINTIDSFNLIVICITIISGLKIIIEFINFLVNRNKPQETFIDELVSKEVYYEAGDNEPYFKCLYKRTWSNGKIEFITSND